MALAAGSTEGGGVVAVGVIMTENGPEEDTAGGPGTAQDGEALALMTYVRALRDKEGVYRVDSGGFGGGHGSTEVVSEG